MGVYNFTEGKSKKEIFVHSEYIQYFERNKIKFDAWGTAGPDFILLDYGLIGEVKKEDTPSLLKAAVKELYNRKNAKFLITNFDAFFVICGDVIRYYDQTGCKKWDDVDLKECVKFSKNNLDIFIDWISSKNHKVDIEPHMDYVLDFILKDDFEMNITDCLYLLFNLNNKFILTRKYIFFNPDQENEVAISINLKKQNKEQILNFIRIFKISNIQQVKDYIKHNYSQHLPDSKKANLGKYYTPKEIVNIVKNWCSNYINRNTYILDLACGCGAFLDIFKDRHIVGRDIDDQAIDVLKIFKFSNVEVDNSLLNVSREKYNLNKGDDIIIVGNPPFNDSSSINKRYSTKSKSKRLPEDKDIHCRDVGRSFLEVYAKLNARIICVLHPLAYLIKETNFKNMKYLNNNYVLKKSIIFNSKIFKDLSHSGSSFPICVSLFERNDIGMQYEDIMKFNFDIYKSKNQFTLQNISCAGHSIIHQTVTSLDTKNNSDIGLYHYNFRDINSLNKANFKEEDYRQKHKTTMVVVNYKNLFKYCYVNCIKKFLIPQLIKKDYYILGNLNPIYNPKDFANTDYQNLFIIGAILKNSHRIKCMSLDDVNNSLLYTKFLINDFRWNNEHWKEEKHKIKHNFYNDFIKFVDKKDNIAKERIYNLLEEYFEQLAGQCFCSHKS